MYVKKVNKKLMKLKLKKVQFVDENSINQRFSDRFIVIVR